MIEDKRKSKAQKESSCQNQKASATGEFVIVAKNIGHCYCG